MTEMGVNGPRGVADSDALLQASRRLDWRFLLPDPELGRVAYVGPARGALLESLRLFAGSLDLWETPASDAATWRNGEQSYESYDVVVAHMPDGAALKWAVTLAGVGGCLYVEGQNPAAAGGKRLAKRIRGFARQARPESLGQCVRMVRELGMGDVAAYWIWPDLDNCTKIMPADDPLPLMQFQMPSLNHPALRTLWHSAIARRLAERLMQAAAPAFGVVAYASYGSGGALGGKAS